MDATGMENGIRSSRGSPAPEQAVVAVVAALALAFRIGAWLSPSRYVVIPASQLTPLNALGILFLVAGVWAWAARRSPLTRVFLVYAIGSSVHWGGSIATANAGLEIAILTFYMAATAMGDAAFLHFALRYPPALVRLPFRTWILYAVAILTLVAVPLAPFVPKAAVETGLGVVIGVSFLMSIVAGVVFLVRWLRSCREDRRRYHLTAIAVALVVTTALDVLADVGALPGEPEAWTLPYGLVPLVFVRALLRSPAATLPPASGR